MMSVQVKEFSLKKSFTGIEVDDWAKKRNGVKGWAKDTNRFDDWAKDIKGVKVWAKDTNRVDDWAKDTNRVDDWAKDSNRGKDWATYSNKVDDWAMQRDRGRLQKRRGGRQLGRIVKAGQQRGLGGKLGRVDRSGLAVGTADRDRKQDLYNHILSTYRQAHTRVDRSQMLILSCC